MIGLILIAVLLVLAFNIVKNIVQIHSRILMMKKSQKVIAEHSDLETRYQIIKDLY